MEETFFTILLNTRLVASCLDSSRDTNRAGVLLLFIEVTVVWGRILWGSEADLGVVGQKEPIGIRSILPGAPNLVVGVSVGELPGQVRNRAF